MSGRSYLRALILLALANYLAIPGALTLADLLGVLPMAAKAAFIPPATTLAIALAAALVVRTRAAETGANRLWAMPIFIWVASAGPFQASAPVSIVAMFAAGHAEAGLSMLSAAVAPLAALAFVGIYRPPPQPWLGQRLITLLVVLAVLVDLALLLPRLLAMAGGWLGLMALTQPGLDGPARILISARFALAPLAERLATWDLSVAGLPIGVHMLVLLGGLVMLVTEGEWRPAGEGGFADFPAIPPGDRR